MSKRVNSYKSKSGAQTAARNIFGASWKLHAEIIPDGDRWYISGITSRDFGQVAEYFS